MRTLLLTCIATALFACQIEPEPINYGKDNCHFCKMTIMDAKFAAEVVTEKGKIYKYDDLSCMVKSLKMDTKSAATHAFVLVNDFNTQKFVDAKKATLVENADYRSPMSGNVAAFEQKPNKVTESVITWDELFSKF